MKDILKVLFICGLLKLGSGAKILAILGTDMNSHFKVMTGVLEAISSKHEVTFYVHPKFKYQYENITTKDTPHFDINKDLSKNSPLKDPCKVDDFMIYTKFIMHSNMEFYDIVYQSASIRELMTQRGEYDLMIINAYGAQHFLPLAQHLDLKMIQVSPSIVDIWLSEGIREKDRWDIRPSFQISDKADSLFGRLKRYLKNAYLWYHYHTSFEATINKAIKKYYRRPSILEEDMARTSLVFVNTHTAMGLQKSSSRAVVEIAGSHISEEKPLPIDLKNFMDNATEGVIYFSLGTVVQGESMDKNIIKAMLRSFAKIKQKVLWKIKDDLEDVPENVKFGRWFPQQDILRHRNTKVFITQGGMLSMTEACTMGVPTLIMPVLFDQKTNAQKAEELGYGITLNFCHFTEQKFYKALTELLNNKTYTQKARQVSKIMKNDQETLKEKISFWTDFILEQKTDTVLSNKQQPSFLETMPADIFICLTSTATIFIILLTYILRLLYPFVKSNFKLKGE